MSLKDLLSRCLIPLDLPGEELNYLAGSLVEVINQRLQDLNNSLQTAEFNSEAFQAKYRMNFDSFCHCRSGSPEDYPLEDYVTWGFWEKVKKNKMSLLHRYEQLKHSPEEC